MLLMLACSGKATTETEAPPPPPPPEVVEDVEVVDEVGHPPEEVEPDSHPVAASWRGEACGARAYPRELTFLPDFRYQGRDLVSPCPEGATCVWSGIVQFEGTWKDDGPFLTLTETSTDGAGQGSPRPTVLRRAQSGHLTEEQSEGVICGYEKSAEGSADQVPEAPM
ncbi:MAG: hypothetical protein GY913_25785 [Proteobacteria bacterium]|nr:hypothetical protein [Pseudomonadota bacterium]